MQLFIIVAFVLYTRDTSDNDNTTTTTTTIQQRLKYSNETPVYSFIATPYHLVRKQFARHER